ncbi:MAG: pseudouridine synthase [bacterium]
MPHGKSPKHVRKKTAKKTAKKTSRGGSAKSRKQRDEHGEESERAVSRGAASRPRSSAGAAGAASRSESAGGAPRRSTTASLDRSAAGSSAGGPEDSIRLQKLLASAGFGSRRQVEQFLIDERVTVNGRVARLGDRANPSIDEIRVDGERLARERLAYWIVNKPRGVVTTVRDEAGRRTVMDLLPDSVGRLFPVGRLDRETTGLLLLTNDGDTAHALLHPSLGNEREYRVSVKGELDDRAVRRLEKGVSLEEGRTAPARISRLRFDPDQGNSIFSLTLVEGRKRQIRRSLLILGFPVRRLARVRMGPLRIGRLGVGEARPLRAEERRALLEHVNRLREAEADPKGSSRGASRAQRTARSRKGTSR